MKLGRQNNVLGILGYMDYFEIDRHNFCNETASSLGYRIAVVENDESDLITLIVFG